eukprot:1014336-Amphidinium_carterae.1
MYILGLYGKVEEREKQRNAAKALERLLEERFAQLEDDCSAAVKHAYAQINSGRSNNAKSRGHGKSSMPDAVCMCGCVLISTAQG